MKRLKQTTLNPMVRLLAAGAVLVWLGASGFCTLETLIGHPQEAVDAGHVVEQAASAHHDAAPPQDSDRHDGHERSCCSSLQAAESALHSVILEKPDFGQINALLPGWSTPLFTLSERQETFSRETPERKWVFTPEVCLGPAFRSHAPPFAV
jgi:hypothetical protein